MPRESGDDSAAHRRAVGSHDARDLDTVDFAPVIPARRAAWKLWHQFSSGTMVAPPAGGPRARDVGADDDRRRIQHRVDGAARERHYEYQRQPQAQARGGTRPPRR
jgi:hypothetical protein